VPIIRKAAAGEPASTDDHRELAVRYEQLRADALAGAGHGWRWGRALLERQGLAVWIGSWRQLAVATPVPSRPAAATAVPAGSEQLVAVLAAMALAVTTTAGGCV
jgi:hypothetical protein